MERHIITLGQPLREVHARNPLTGQTIAVTINQIIQKVEPSREVVEKQQAENEHQEVMDSLESIQAQLEEMSAARRQSLAELQELAVRLSVKIARSIIYTEIADDTSRIEHLVEMSLAQLDADTPIVVHVHPEVYSRLNHSHAAVLRREKLHIVADPEIAIGDCSIVGPAFTFFAGVESKLAEIEQKLVEGLSNAEIERRHPGKNDRGLQRFPDRRNLA